MMKPIAALPGQVVTVATSGLTVDGHRLVNSVPLPRDYEGRALPVISAGTYKVAAGEVWLVSSFNPRSYDSRYFGPVAVTDIVASARPLLTDANP
jgi:conjugative transfer signal peptidase TraF